MRLAIACRAEWPLVRRRVLRTRLGVWLVLLVGGTALLGTHSAATLEGQLARLGMLSALLAASFAAGSASDRAALLLTLSHPATPAELVVGRGVATFGLAVGAVVVALAGIVPLRHVAPAAAAGALLGGIGAAAAATGAALATVALGGTGLVGALFAYTVLASPVAPAAWDALSPGGVIGALGTVALEGLPSLWRFRLLAQGDSVAWLHALAWAAGGSTVAVGMLARRTR